MCGLSVVWAVKHKRAVCVSGKQSLDEAIYEKYIRPIQRPRQLYAGVGTRRSARRPVILTMTRMAPRFRCFAVRASDSTVLNTCQVCNGSPYAYFEQDGDEFICQNCRNRFASVDVGRVSGGCNPVPITAEVYTEQDGTITVPASFLEENASRFSNWKNF